MNKQKYIYRVAFREPPQEDGKTEFYFTSLAAIYETFTAKQVGCGVQHLYNLGISDGNTYEGRRATITRETLASKEQSNPRNRRTGEGQ